MNIRHHALICLLTICVAIAGCNTTGTVLDPARFGPSYAPQNYYGVPRLPATVRRVLLLPLSGGEVAPGEIAGALNPVFTSALQRENRFEVVAISRTQCLQAFGAEEFRSTASLPHQFLQRVHELYGVDAVMFVDLTVMRTLRPLALGVRAKLVTTDAEADMLWNFDEVLSAGEPRVMNSARRYFLLNDDGMVPVDRSDAILQSPSRYAAYVATATFKTLPPR